MLQEKAHIKDKCSSYAQGEKNTNDKSINALNYNSTPNWLKLMAEHKAVKEKVEETLRKDCQEDGLLPAKFEEHNVEFLEVFKGFRSIWGGRLCCINVGKHRID